MNFSSIFASALTQMLLDSLWQGALLALLAALLLRALRHRSAALRHIVGMGFLLAMVLLPLGTLASLLGAGSVIASTGLTISAPQGNATLQLLAPGSHLINAPIWLTWFWFAGVVVMLLRLIGGGWMVRRLDRMACKALPPIWLARFDALRGAMGIRREVDVRLLQGVGQPCVARVWRPVIWLPISMLTQLTPDQIEALLAHELAHVRRLDWIWNGLQRVIEALLFYHPGVWWLNRRIRQERENACDDLAVAACGDAIVLAEALANLERLRSPTHIFALPANGGSLMDRVTRLLLPDAPARSSWRAPVGLLTVLCSGALLAAQAAPTLDRTLAGPTMTAAQAHGTGNSSYSINGLFLGGWRVYKESVSPQGHVTEIYSVNGQPSPIDASVRKWIDSKRDMSSQVVAPVTFPAPPAIPSPPSPATGHWWQVAGNSFKISAPFADRLHVYKTWTNLRGRVSESYSVNGKPAPINAGVRQWIKDAQTKSAGLARFPLVPVMPPMPSVKS